MHRPAPLPGLSPALHPGKSRPVLLTLPLLLAGALSGPASWAQPTPSPSSMAPAAALARHYAIPAGPLTTALNRFAEESGVLLAASGATTEGRRSPGLNGRYDVSTGFAALLAGTGLEAFAQADGSYGLRTLPTSRLLPTTGQTAVLSTITVSGTDEETATGPVHGYVARRSATGTKFDTLLIDTPQSISVVTQDELRARQAETLGQALDYTPGFTSQPTSFNRTADRFRIRGMDVESANSGSLRDGLRLQSNSYDGTQEPYGLERVEVLRGAASVLYGQLSPGGVVNAVSKRPTTETLRELGLQLGTHDRRQLTGDFSGAMADRKDLDYRLTVLARDSNTQERHIQDDKLYIAPALTWRPSADTTFTLLSFYQKTNTRFAAPLPYRLVEGVGDGPHYIRRGSFIGEPSYDKMKGEMLTLGYQLDHALNASTRLHHSLRYFESKMSWNYLQAQTGAAAIDDAATTGMLRRQYSDRREHAKGLASDTRLTWKGELGGLQQTMLVGLDAYRMDYDSQNFRAAAPSLDLNAPQYGQAIPVNRDPALNRGSRLKTTQVGLYAQNQVQIGERWSLLFGLRHDWADQDQTAHRDGNRARQRNEATTWRAGLVYKADNGLAPYLSYSESFYPVSVAEVSGQTFRPTRGKQYEAGIRYQPSGSRTLLSAAVYELVQDNVLKFDAGQNTYRQAGEVRSRGLELEARTELSRHLSLVASYAYTDARVTRSTLPAEIGQRSENTPFHQAALWADYNFGAWGHPELRIAAGARYKGATRASGIASPMSAYTLFDALLVYRVNARLDLSINVSNLMDKKITNCEFAICRYGDARQASANLTYRW